MQPCRFPVYKFFNESARPAGRKVKCPGHKYTLIPVPGTCFTAHFPALPPARHTQLHSFSSAKASLMSLCVPVWIYAREREWVYGYEWVCGARMHTHTHDVEKSLWCFQASKLIRKFFHARASALSPCPLPLPPRPCGCSKFHFLPKSPGLSYFPTSFWGIQKTPPHS